MRRGGRARLKASDSKSDRGPEGPSGVQILSPPPIFCATGGSSFRGGVTERPKVRHWKCRARVIPVPRVQIPPPPPIFLIYRRSRFAGLRGSTVGQQPPWPGSGARRSGADRRGWFRRPTVGESRRWINPDVAVLDGELAVPFAPQSASAGSNSHSEGGPC